MSRIGQKPIDIPAGVNVTVDGATVSVKGPMGELTAAMPGNIAVTVDGSVVTVQRPDERRQSRSFHGLARSLVANMIEGVSKGFSKELEIEGVGYRATIQGQTLEMAVGYSSPVVYVIPEGIKCEVANNTKLKVSGADKQKVGEVAARIRDFAPAEPYKGKGIKYVGERIRRKEGKTVA